MKHHLAFATRALLLLGVGFGCLSASRGATSEPAHVDAIAAQEEAETLAALKPPKRERPLVAVLGHNEGSETTDYLVPFGVLERSGLADVFALGVKPGLVKLMPALTIVPDATASEFDQRFPEGADYVFVPAMHVQDDAAVLAWIARQAQGGATVVGVCAGALVLANAGVLHHKRATTHWFRVSELSEADPTIRYVPDRRYVVDRGAVTTFWRHETVGLPVANGVDEVALALVSNALLDITQRYGARAARVARMELEYPQASAAVIARTQ